MNVEMFGQLRHPTVGDPPVPDAGLCLPKTTGICSGGPNFGLPCDTPHGFPTAQCPPNPAPPPPDPSASRR